MEERWTEFYNQQRIFAADRHAQRLTDEALQWMEDQDRMSTGYVPIRPTTRAEYHGVVIPFYLEETVLRIERHRRGIGEPEATPVLRPTERTLQLELPLRQQAIQNAKKLLEDLYKEYGVPLRSKDKQTEQTREQGHSRGF